MISISASKRYNSIAGGDRKYRTFNTVQHNNNRPKSSTEKLPRDKEKLVSNDPIDANTLCKGKNT